MIFFYSLTNTSLQAWLGWINLAYMLNCQPPDNFTMSKQTDYYIVNEETREQLGLKFEKTV